jgi:hypothetical protein
VRWLGEIREREKFSREGGRSSASGSSFPSIPTAYDKRKKGFEGSPESREDLSRPLSSSWSVLQKKIRGRER